MWVVNTDHSSKLLSFEKTAFFVHVSGDRQTDGHRHRVKPPLALRATET